MPETNALSTPWYETANIHLCTLLDFTELCDTLDIRVEQCITLSNGRARTLSGAPGLWQNLTAEQAVFALNRG